MNGVIPNMFKEPEQIEQKAEKLNLVIHYVSGVSEYSGNLKTLGLVGPIWFKTVKLQLTASFSGFTHLKVGLRKQ